MVEFGDMCHLVGGYERFIVTSIHLDEAGIGVIALECTFARMA